MTLPVLTAYDVCAPKAGIYPHTETWDKQGFLPHQGVSWAAAIVLPFARPGHMKYVYYHSMFQFFYPAPPDRTQKRTSPPCTLSTKKKKKKCRKLPLAVVMKIREWQKQKTSALQLNSSLFHYDFLLLTIPFHLIFLSCPRVPCWHAECERSKVISITCYTASRRNLLNAPKAWPLSYNHTKFSPGTSLVISSQSSFY